tara:strand:+ start:2117 stop:2365 length:249 start_codon:yes stop_codon:yes gene_type:complete
MFLPEEIITLIIHFARGISSHKGSKHIKDINTIGKVMEHGVKRALVHLKEIKALKKAYDTYDPFLAGSGGRVFWGDTYHLNI